MPKKKSNSLDGEHIFPNTTLQPMVARWKEISKDETKEDQAMELLEEVVIKTTEMLQRLAQNEGYHHTVDLDILVSAAQQKIPKWMEGWEPNKGKLFSWFSVCAKYAFISELNKVNQFRSRHHVTSDNLDQFYGSEDHASQRRDSAEELRMQLRETGCRWGNRQERGAIRYLLECIMDDTHSKQNSIRSAAYAFCISIELSKFFYNWVLHLLRDIMYHKIHIPFTEQDLFIAENSYEHFTSLFTFDNTPLTFEHAKYVCAVFGGQRLKVPTLAQMAKVRDDYRLFRELEHTDLTPDDFGKVGKRYSKNSKAAQEIYTEMTERLNPVRSGNYEIYGEDPENN